MIESTDTQLSRRISDATSMTDITATTFVQITEEEWNERWEKGINHFHKEYTHEFLQKHVDKLIEGRQGLKVLVPMCGKTFDMKWLADQGHTVIGVEWAEQAVLGFFKDQDMEYTKESLSDNTGDLYKSADGRIRIYRCQFFDFSSRSMEDDFDVIWDRGAFGVVNPEDRERYVKGITSSATSDCRILLATMVYDVSKWPGPPHCISYEGIQKLYGDEFSVKSLDQKEHLNDWWRNGGPKSMQEVLHLLTRK